MKKKDGGIDVGKYQVKTFRLHPETYDKLKEVKEDSGMSWNRFFHKILKEVK